MTFKTALLHVELGERRIAALKWRSHTRYMYYDGATESSGRFSIRRPEPEWQEAWLAKEAWLAREA
jgi:hypothetical protein